MRRKLFSIFATLAILLAIAACQEFNELLPLNAKKKDSKVLVKEIATGARIKSANGVNFGPDGNLYIASFGGQEIIVMNSQNGKIMKRFGPADGVISPDDLVFGPDGSLYWTDINIGEVGRISPDGTLTKQPVAPGVNPITF